MVHALTLLALEEVADKVHAANRTLILCGAPAQPARLMHQAEFERHIGRENICANVQQALERARQVHAQMRASA
jgi:MFS superfamily sulfate permease-like transporter